MINAIYPIEKIKSGILHNFFVEPLIAQNYITKITGTNPHVFFCFADKPGLIIIDDTPFTVQLYYQELYNRQFSNILVIGLGLGILTYLCQDFCNEVDVLEIDEDLVDKIREKNFLKQNVNLIKGDVFNFDTTKKYDVICLDCWNYDTHENLDSEIQLLQQKFNKNLNEGGIIYTPIIRNISNNL